MDISEVAKVEAQQRVLLVEDDTRLAELITEYLGQNGLEVHTERRGDLAVERPTSSSPTCWCST
jgi:DNA-binding response OmpR family regulator